MTPTDDGHGRQRPTLDELILAAFRAEGVVFPLSDEEVERFCGSVDAEPIPPKLIERTVATVLGHETRLDRTRQVPLWFDSESGSVTSAELEVELVALHRNEGELSPDIQEKLEQYRQRIRDEEQNADGPDSEEI